MLRRFFHRPNTNSCLYLIIGFQLGWISTSFLLSQHQLLAQQQHDPSPFSLSHLRHPHDPPCASPPCHRSVRSLGDWGLAGAAAGGSSSANGAGAGGGGGGAGGASACNLSAEAVERQQEAIVGAMQQQEAEMRRLRRQLVEGGAGGGSAVTATGDGAGMPLLVPVPLPLLLGPFVLVIAAVRLAAVRASFVVAGEAPCVRDLARKNGTLQWNPKPQRYLIAMCSGGQLSNRLACVRQSMLDAALMNRTLVFPTHGIDYNYDALLDMGAFDECFGPNRVVSFAAYNESVKGRVRVGRFICHVHVYQTEAACDDLMQRYTATLHMQFAKKEIARRRTPGPWFKYPAGDFLRKFNSDHHVIAFGNMFGVGGRELRFQGAAPLVVSPQCRGLLQPSPAIQVRGVWRRGGGGGEKMGRGVGCGWEGCWNVGERGKRGGSCGLWREGLVSSRQVAAGRVLIWKAMASTLRWPFLSPATPTPPPPILSPLFLTLLPYLPLFPTLPSPHPRPPSLSPFSQQAAVGFVNMYLGPSYAAVHLRRGDFFQHCIHGNGRLRPTPCYQPLHQVASCLHRRLQRLPGVSMVFLASNADETERRVLRETLTALGSSHTLISLPHSLQGHAWAEPLERAGVAGSSEVVSFLDKAICALALQFYGTAGSTFSSDIMRHSHVPPMCSPMWHPTSHPMSVTTCHASGDQCGHGKVHSSAALSAPALAPWHILHPLTSIHPLPLHIPKSSHLHPTLPWPFSHITPPLSSPSCPSPLSSPPALLPSALLPCNSLPHSFPAIVPISSLREWWKQGLCETYICPANEPADFLRLPGRSNATASAPSPGAGDSSLPSVVSAGGGAVNVSPRQLQGQKQGKVTGQQDGQIAAGAGAGTGDGAGGSAGGAVSVGGNVGETDEERKGKGKKELQGKVEQGKGGEGKREEGKSEGRKMAAGASGKKERDDDVARRGDGERGKKPERKG
ncbi:unnamed protein product [Closterium sp. NIES-64]|nr:unnamed protein product [Closterium sp. NIES-64]